MADIDPSWQGAEQAHATIYDQNLPVDEEIDTSNVPGAEGDD